MPIMPSGAWDTSSAVSAASTTGTNLLMKSAASEALAKQLEIILRAVPAKVVRLRA
jgi:hypothetical protein